MRLGNSQRFILINVERINILNTGSSLESQNKLQKDILSDECDKDSGYEPDQVNLWSRNSSAANRANFRQKKQRSLDVHDVSADYYALLSPRLGSDSSYQNYDPSYHDTSLYNQIRYQSLDRPVKRRRKVPESILKNGYNSLPRGSSSLARQENLRSRSYQILSKLHHYFYRYF